MNDTCIIIDIENLRKEENMRSNKNATEEPQPAKLGVNNIYKEQYLPQKESAYWLG